VWEKSHKLSRERLQLAFWDADQCWKELERICAEGVGKHYSSDVNFGHASRVVEALARKGEKDVGRLLDLLGKKVEDFETDLMAWLEIFLVKLAGEMRLERAIPLVVKKLHECGEVLSEQCVEALGKIGTDAAAAAVAEGWLDTEWDYQSPLHLLDKVEHRWADHRIVGVGDGHGGEIGLVGERVAPAFVRPHVVDRAFAVCAQERARTRLDAIAAFLLVPLQVGGDELVRCHAQVRRNPGNIGSASQPHPASKPPRFLGRQVVARMACRSDRKLLAAAGFPSVPENND
jgi:hypothetical protein